MTEIKYSDGGELLTRILRANGVDSVFGVISVHNIPLVERVASELRFVPVRHEAAAINAADGYARARGSLGCAITSTGTGAGNASGSMIEALSASTPLLHITTNIPTQYIDGGRGFIHEFTGQTRMIDSFSVWSARISTGEVAPKILQMAIRRALGSPGGPVTVEWPIDLQYLGGLFEFEEDTQDPPRRCNDGQLRQAADLLANAERPTLWVGGGARNARDEVRDLAEKLGAGVFTSNAGRGILPEDHPLCIGNYGTSAGGGELLEASDVLLSVGTHFRSNETNTYKMKIPPRHLQIDIDAEAIGRSYPVEIGLTGEAKTALGSINRFIKRSRRSASWATRVTESRARVRREHRSALGNHAAICDALRDNLPREGIVARDVTIASSSWGNRLLEIYDPSCNIFARGGGIGQGLAMGIGASIGCPRVPTVVIVGDGGIAVHLGELLTLMQERPNVTVIVFNDRGYGVLRNAQLARSAEPRAVDLFTADFAKLADSLGLPYWLVVESESAMKSFREALSMPGPKLIEVDLEKCGPMSVAFTPPVEVPATVQKEV